MNRSDLVKAQVVGFFSLPSSSLAEHNPTAYQNAMAGAPKGSGSCAYCGMGILHHVVIQLPDGSRHFIGSDCAQKIGGEVAYCAKDRLTSEQRAAKQAKRDAQLIARKAELEAITARRKTRYEQLADIFETLEAEHRAVRQYEHQDTFWASLARQLQDGPLSYKQAHWVAKCILERRNKSNAVEWDSILDRCTAAE
jgi:hypothetical protein